MWERARAACSRLIVKCVISKCRLRFRHSRIRVRDICETSVALAIFPIIWHYFTKLSRFGELGRPREAHV